MASMEVLPIRDDLPFGARIRGVSRDTLKDGGIRELINQTFEGKGMIIFEDIEPSCEMHVALSEVFGPLKEHPVVTKANDGLSPGIVDMHVEPGKSGVVALNGTRLASWLPWHFDHCYNDELNRGGVLRAIDIVPEGGLTGFVDGVGLYDAFSPELRDRIEGLNVIYTLNLQYADMRFGKPEGLVEIVPKPGADAVMDYARQKGTPRAIHPAVWTRASGEKVLHVSPWMAEGIEGREDADGDALLEAVCQEINAKAKDQCYFHQWRPTDMVIWDNWRMLHAVSGMDPQYARRMQRTTIKGDYGLGYFENGGVGDEVLEMTV